MTILVMQLSFVIPDAMNLKVINFNYRSNISSGNISTNGSLIKFASDTTEDQQILFEEARTMRHFQLSQDISSLRNQTFEFT